MRRQYRIDKEYETIMERQQEIENGTAKLVAWDELRKELGYTDDDTMKEKVLEQKLFDRIMAENKRIYEMLLS